MQKKIIAFTVLHKKITKKFPEFEKLINTNIKYCDFLILNDKYFSKKEYLNISKNKKLNFHILNSNRTPDFNRAKGLGFCIKKKYDYIINFDADDNPSKNYFSKIKKYIKNNRSNLFYTNLKFGKKNFIPKETIILDNILNYNYLGYGCSVMRPIAAKLFINICKYKSQSTDWLFALSYLSRFKSVKCARGINIQYIKHNNNFLGPKPKIDKKYILKSLNTKINIYKNVIKFFNIKLKNKKIIKEKLIFLKKKKKMIKSKKNFNFKKNLISKKFYYWYEINWRNLFDD